MRYDEQPIEKVVPPFGRSELMAQQIFELAVAQVIAAKQTDDMVDFQQFATLAHKAAAVYFQWLHDSSLSNEPSTVIAAVASSVNEAAARPNQLAQKYD